MIREERQQGVRGGAGDDLQEAQLLELPEGAHQVAPASGVGFADPSKPAVIEEGQFVEGLLPMGAVDFLSRECDQVVEVPLIPCLQQRVSQHRAERGRQRQRETGFEAIRPPTLEELQQGHVGFRNGLEQPVLFQEPVVLGVPDKRQVCVKDKSKVAGHNSLESKV